MQKTGLFFGSFNPIHIGHLIIANHLIEYSDLSEIWFVVSPHNPFKEKNTLLDDNQRLQMVRLVCEKYPKLKASNIEFSLPKPSYTIDTMTYLHEKYPTKIFALIMGEDNLHSLHKWKNHEKLVENYPIYVYPRIFEKSNEIKIGNAKIIKIDSPIIEISSTLVRKMIKEKKNFKPLLTKEVFDYIDGSNLYQ